MRKKLSIEEEGRVVGIKGPLIKIEGLPHLKMGEEVLIGKENQRGYIFKIEREFTPATLIYQDFSWALTISKKPIKIKEKVKRTKRVLEIPVGDEFLGRIVDPLGQDLETKIKIETKEKREIERKPPEVLDREVVRKPLETGIKLIDALFPLGRGQRELILGDRKTGKTSLALDSILNQKEVISIFTSIGQKKEEVLRIKNTLLKFGVLKRTILVAASASDSPFLQYLAPFSAMTLAEYFRDKGKDVLIVFDDLTKHAQIWREISLLLGTPPGREAYPGDIFYLHARLLERAGNLKSELGGSITALPICETQEGDITSYIPTNLISITDGQIYLEKDLFQAGQKPAINIGLSVSRIGSQAQRECLKETTKGLKLTLSQHRELKKLVQLESKLSLESQKILKRGDLLLEIFKQEKHQLVDSANQSMIYFLAINGFLDDLEIEKIKTFENQFYRFVDSLYPEFKENLLKKGWTKEIKEEFLEIFKKFKETI